MKVDIYYFSGTGNTAWMVRRLAEHLLELGDEVITASCENLAAADVDPTACDVMGIAFPVYASFAPSLVRDFVAGLPSAVEKPLFAMTTAGYAADDTARYTVRPLCVKGYEPFVLANVLVSNNLRLPVLSPLPIPSPEEMVHKLERASRKVDRLAGLIHRREHHVEGAGPFGRLFGVAQRLSVGPFEALAFKGFFADETCTRCGWCVSHCPTHNIKMTDHGVEFLDRCIVLPHNICVIRENL